MGRVPSSEILAKDVIGYAQELVREDSARRLIRSLGIQYYNQSILEIYNISILINPNEYNIRGNLSDADSNLSVSSESDKIYNGDLTSTGFDKYDKIMNAVCLNDDERVECFGIDSNEFNSYYNLGEAPFPYEDSIVYSLREGYMDLCFGEDITPSTPVITVLFRTTPVFLTDSNYESAYMGISDRYFPLLTNRIASLAEIRRGITDNTMSIVKMLYDQMISELNPDIQLRIKKMLNTGE